ncbi:GNAT family N-acetyltransferase [Pelagibius marinus]|uniref:GNAT family N-acetyltransferase n=1 Tax=Pelagibius marinus TaxID=2762760 RepID=UPI0018727A56|nr:GNAT family N-acetyltransferase [Pelagibius marinus]
MPSTALIRPPRPDDYDQWLPLWHAYNVFYGHAWGPGGEPPVEPDVTAMTWGRLFDDAQPLWGLVAEAADGRLLGFTHYLYHLSTNVLGSLCYLEDLFTAEAARGQGVGRALIEAVCDAAMAAGAKRVYWQTQGDNATARRLYDAVAKNSGAIIYEREIKGGR